jgi:hypothetical protein
MKKEHLVIGTVFTLTALAQQACYRADVPIQTISAKDAPVTPTPFQPLPPTPQEGIFLSPPEVAPTQTPAPEEIFAQGDIEFDQPKEVFVRITLPNTRTLNFSYLPLFYPDNLLPDEQAQLVRVDFRPGTHTGLTTTDGKNIILELHSGYEPGMENKDEAEDIRSFLEGNSDSTTQDAEYIRGRIGKLVGSLVGITQDGTERTYFVSAAAFLPHEEKLVFDSDIRAALTLAESADINSGFTTFKVKPGILLAFCGWGPEGTSNDYTSDDYRYTYTEYIIGLTPLE